MAPRVQLLGEAVIEAGPGAPRLALEQHDAVLLALLALRGRTRRGELAEQLWPGVVPRKSRQSLRQRVHRLRGSVPGVLAGDVTWLWLDPDLEHDLHPQALAQGNGEFSLLGNLRCGEDLADLVQRLRDQWLVLRTQALLREAQSLQAAGELDAAAEVAERLATGLPVTESAHRLCMRLHYLRGDRGRAMAAYRRCEALLQNQLGMRPDPETQALASVIAASGAPDTAAGAPAAAVALQRPPRLVGRARSWALLDEALAARLVVVMQGEAGIGKTRLATDFARARGSSLVAKAHESEQAAPFALARRVVAGGGVRGGALPADARAELARFMPGWGLPAAAPAELQRLRASFMAALMPWSRLPQALLVLDDVQWADAASLDLIVPWLSAADGPAPATLLCVRSGELPVQLEEWLDTLPPTAVLRDELGPLDHASVEELIASLALPGLSTDGHAEAASNLMRLTSGQPMVLLEWLRAHPHGWSWRGDAGRGGAAANTLAALLRRRMARLPPERQRVVRVAALAGPTFTPAMAAEVLQLPGMDTTRVIRHLHEAQLLDEGGQLLDVVREAMVQDTPASIAASLHGRIARHLAARGEGPEVVAAHWLAGRCFGEAAPLFEVAARTTQANGRLVEALRYWDLAAAAFGQAGDGAGAWAAREGGLTAALSVESGNTLADRLHLMAQQAPDDAARLVVYLATARALLNSAPGVAALEPAQAALNLARRLGDPAREAAAAGWQGLALAMSGRTSEGLALLQGYAEPASRVDDLRVRLDFAGSLGYALHLAGEYEQALDALRSAAALAESIGDLGDALEQTGNIATCLASLGRRDEAVQQGEAAVELWRRLGEPKSVTGAAQQVQLAATYLGQGRFREALAHLEWARRCFRELGPTGWQTITEHRLALTYLRLGQPARARQVLSPLPPASDPGRIVMRAMIECRLDALAGERVAERLQRVADEWLDRLAPADRRSLQLLLAAHLPAHGALDLAATVHGDAIRAGDGPAARHAAARMADAQRALGHAARAGHWARLAWGDEPEAPALDIDHPGLCQLVLHAARCADDGVTAAAALASALAWLKRALPQVPDAFRESFRVRNPVHRELLALASAS